MSNTYKDRPRWVRSNDPQEARDEHHGADHERGEPCTLTVPLTWASQWRHRGCHYDIPGSQIQGRGPTNDDLHDQWWGPQRRSERDRGRELVGQYNTFGEIDEDRELAPEQHRRRIRQWWL